MGLPISDPDRHRSLLHSCRGLGFFGLFGVAISLLGPEECGSYSMFGEGSVGLWLPCGCFEGYNLVLNGFWICSASSSWRICRRMEGFPAVFFSCVSGFVVCF